MDSFLISSANARSYQKFSRAFQRTFSLPASQISREHIFREAAIMAKQTRITIETDPLLILRGRAPKRAWCPQCAEEVEMLALENAGVISNLDPRALEEWLNSGELHQLQTIGGLTLTCLNSLLARVQKTSTPPGRSAATKPKKEKK
jgi:hypothetical protein